MKYKLGRQPPVFSPTHLRAARAASVHFAALGPPPLVSADFTSAVTDLVGDNWGVMGNDRLGNCTAADCAHTLMVRSANTGHWKMPSEADVVALYAASTGYDPDAPRDIYGENPTDDGAEEGAICAYMRDVGLLGHRSIATAPIVTGLMDAAGLDRIRWSIQLFGACRLGVDLPVSAGVQFDAREAWAIAGDLTPDGGHDVPAVGYDPDHLFVITWGRMQRVRWDWLARFGEEAHAELFPEFLMSTGLSPTGFDLPTLLAELAVLSA